MSTLFNFETGGDVDQPIGDLGGDEYGWGQSFLTGSDTVTITSVEVYIKKNATITDNVTVSIQTDSSNKPSGSLVDANATATIAQTSTSYGWVVATFPASFQLNSATKYWITCEVPIQSVNNNYSWYMDSEGGYADGGNSSRLNSGAWGSAGTADFYFRVNGSIYVAITTGNGYSFFM